MKWIQMRVNTVKAIFYYKDEEGNRQTEPTNFDETGKDEQLNNIQDFIYSLRPDYLR